MKRIINTLAATGLFLSSFTWLGALPARAAAATCIWSGAGADSNIATAANWDCASGPVDGDDLVFPVTVTNRAVNNNKTGFKPRSITFTGAAGGAYTITGNPMEITSGITMDATGGEALNHKIETNLTLTGSQDWILGSNKLYIGKDDGTSTLNLGTFGLNSITGTGALTINSKISGTGNITSTISNLVLKGDNSFSGALNVTNGVLGVQHKNALGTSAGGTTIGDKALIQIWTGITTTDITISEPFTLSGEGVYGVKIQVSDGNNNDKRNVDGPYYVLSGAINLVDSIVVNNGSGLEADLKLTGALTGSGKTIKPKDGSDFVVWVAGSSNATATPNAKYRSAPSSTNLGDGDTGTANAFQAVVAPEGVEAGNVIINAYGYLKGKGSVADATINGGTVAPGLSPGCLTATGTVAFTGGALDVEINGKTVCSEYDQFIVESTGSIDLGSDPDQATLVITRTNFTPAVGDKFTIINNKSENEITTTFKGLDEGDTTKVQGVTYKITYAGGDGNDVVLEVTAVDAAAPTTTEPTSATPGTPNTGITPAKLFTNLLIVSFIGVAISWVLVNRNKESTVKGKR